MQGRHSAIHIAVDDHTRAILAGWLRRQKTPVALAKRAQAILRFCQMSRQQGQNRAFLHIQPPVFTRHARGRRFHIPPQKASLA